MKRFLRVHTFLLAICLVFSFSINTYGEEAQIKPGTFVDIATGDYNSVLLDDNGNVWIWGDIDYREKNDGARTRYANDLFQVKGLSDVKKVFAGKDFGGAIKNDGSVWVWGCIWWGYEGVDNLKSYPLRKVKELDNVISVSTGELFSLVLRKDGTVATCGRQGHFKEITGLNGVVQISAGDDMYTALKNDGSVWVWGYIDDNNYIETPVRIKELDDIVAIDCGIELLALKKDGTVLKNDGNNCYKDSEEFKFNPQKIEGLEQVSQIHTYSGMHIVEKKDGSVWWWGKDNFNREVGELPQEIKVPVKIDGLDDIKKVSMSYIHAVALKNDGSVWGWGSDEHSGLTGLEKINKEVPFIFPHVKDVSKAIIASEDVYLIKKDGTLCKTFFNSCSVVYDTYRDDLSKPDLSRISYKDVKNVQLVYVSKNILKNDGSVWVNGKKLELSNITQISSSDVGCYCVGVNKEGDVYSWKYNSVTRLLEGIPVKNENIQNVSQVAAGMQHITALKKDGTVWVWGENNCFQQGDDILRSQMEPVMIKGLDHIISVSAGKDFSLALTSDGRVWAWGDNTKGMLGIKTETMYSKPVMIDGLTDVVAIASEDEQAMALKADGTVWIWGGKSPSDLSESKGNELYSPIKAKGLYNVRDIDVSKDGYVVVFNDDTITAWGKISPVNPFLILTPTKLFDFGSTSSSFSPKTINDLPNTSITPSPSDVKFGDVNGDGTIDSADYTVLRSFLLGKRKELNNIKAADTYADGEIDTADYMALGRFLLNKVDKLPIMP